MLAQGYSNFDGNVCMLLLLDDIAILQIRIYALYSLDKKILAFMLTTFAIVATITAWIMWTVIASVPGILSSIVPYSLLI